MVLVPGLTHTIPYLHQLTSKLFWGAFPAPTLGTVWRVVSSRGDEENRPKHTFMNFPKDPAPHQAFWSSKQKRVRSCKPTSSSIKLQYEFYMICKTLQLNTTISLRVLVVKMALWMCFFTYCIYPWGGQGWWWWSSFQWPFQDPKLEVPTPYIRPIF